MKKEKKASDIVINKCPIWAVYHENVTGSELDGTKQAKDDDDDVEEVDQDWKPLVAQEVKQLPLCCCDLKHQQEQDKFYWTSLCCRSVLSTLLLSLSVVKATEPQGKIMLSFWCVHWGQTVGRVRWGQPFVKGSHPFINTC